MFDREKGATDLALAFGAVSVNAYTFAWIVLITTFAEALSTALIGLAPVILISFIADGLIMFSVMRTLLSGGGVTGRASLVTLNREWPVSYIARLAMLTIPGFFVLWLVGGVVSQVAGTLSAMILAVPAALFVHAAVLAAFGTMLARIAEGKPGRASKALLRGEGQVGVVFIALVTGPVLAELVIRLALTILVELGLPVFMAEPDAVHLNPVGVVVEIGLRVVSVLIAAYYAATLTRVYLEQREPEGRRLKR